ncbi:MAG: NAD-dependent epimerase/dehydratase family protein [Planctomycetaceae bacterium]
MRALVTGGAGFIGSHIVDALRAAGHEAFVLDDLSSGSHDNLPADVPVYELDIRDTEGVARVFDEVRPEWVSHQAAQMSVSRSVREPSFDAQVNVLGLLNILENAVRVGVQRVTFASSGGALYGDVYTPATEAAAAAPISPYGITKWVGEQYLQFFAKMHGLQSVALRYANVYGPRQNPHGEAGVVAVFTTRMLNGEGTRINGDGKYIRDYVYVGDVARANLMAMTRELPEKSSAFNIGTATGTDVNELNRMIAQACRTELQQRGIDRDVPAPEHGPHRDGDIRSSLVDATKAGEVLGWQPSRAIDAGLRETVGWFAGRELQAAVGG